MTFAFERDGMRVSVYVIMAMTLLGGSFVRGDEAMICQDGEAKLTVIVSPQAGDTVRRAADDLADYLQRISGARFAIESGDDARGVVVGVADDFPNAPITVRFDKGTFARDQYRIVSHDGSLYLLGATPGAVEFAVWDLLQTLGYRYYFPSKDWEVIPSRRTLRIDVDRLERPDFIERSAPRGGLRVRLQPWLQKAWRDWRVRNRTASSFELNTGHAYNGIISRNRRVFEEHPEYLALVDGMRGGSKFCISNPGLRELVVRDAVAQLKADPQLDSISLDPSDGGGWCTCPACQNMGSVSDRVIILANAAAEAINKLGLGDKYIGTYAYNYHSPPPSVRVHPKVIVSLATAFIKGDQTFDEMLAGWSRQTELIGIREYYGLPVWHQSMPGAAQAGSPVELAESIRKQHAAGARFINAESDNAWGPNGLGYYVASRMLWDVKTDPQAVIDDFITHCFGRARQPMREFYAFIGSRPQPSDHMLGVMYRKLKQARDLAEDPRVRRRIDDLALYTRYVELYRQMNDQQTFDTLVRFLWRSRKTNMADAVGMFWYLNRSARRSETMTWMPGEPKSCSLPPERLRTRGEEPFSEAEITALIDQGIAHHDVLALDPREFSDDLAPAGSVLKLDDVKPMGSTFFGGAEGSTTTRGALRNYTWIAEPPRTIHLQVRTGLIYDVRGPATVELAHHGPIGVEKIGFAPVDTAAIPEDGKWHDVEFTAQKRGLYRITWTERLSGTQVKWPQDLPRTVQIRDGHRKQVSGRQSWYFYVPKGTRVIGAYSQAGAGGLYDSQGRQVLDFNKTSADYVCIDVPDGQDGRLWSVRKLAGRFRLLNVPPYAAARVTDLLLPRDVLERDRSQSDQ